MTDFSFTIAIPTYNRADLLRRALISVEKQTLPASEVIVSDNASPGDEVGKVVAEFLHRIPNLRLVRHEKNIGAEANFFGCLAYSSNDLFMWLADDDELSPDCLWEMINMFKNIDSLATAVPIWHFYTDKDNFKVMPARSYESPYWFLRAAKFMYKATDELFYGLHKRDTLSKCSLKTYGWPNEKETLNLVYPFLLEILISGKIVVTENESAFWKNHDYGIKYHAESYTATKVFSSSSFITKLKSNVKYIIRRINLQALYLSKIFIRGGYFAVLFLFFVSILSVCRDVIELFYNQTVGRLKRTK
jgi:glycosyltransferase involved in cell wall biosynthesis